MAACAACGGMTKRLERNPDGPGLVMATCSACKGTGKEEPPFRINYPPEVMAALQNASTALKVSAVLRNAALPKP